MHAGQSVGYRAARADVETSPEPSEDEPEVEVGAKSRAAVAEAIHTQSQSATAMASSAPQYSCAAADRDGEDPRCAGGDVAPDTAKETEDSDAALAATEDADTSRSPEHHKFNVAILNFGAERRHGQNLYWQNLLDMPVMIGLLCEATPGDHREITRFLAPWMPPTGAAPTKNKNLVPSPPQGYAQISQHRDGVDAGAQGLVRK